MMLRRLLQSGFGEYRPEMASYAGMRPPLRREAEELAILSEKKSDRGGFISMMSAGMLPSTEILPERQEVADQDEMMEEDDGSVISSLPVPLVLVSPEGRVLEINDLARELLGGRAYEGNVLSDVMEGLGRPLTEWISAIAFGQNNNRAEILRVNDNEAERFVQVSLRPMQQDFPSNVLAVLNDATDLKTLEAQFVQAQKMQAIGQLAGGIAHDFNNLLTAISGHCDLMLMRTQLEDQNYDDLLQISQNAHRAASLVGQLLAFSRKQTLQPELLVLDDVMREIGALLNRLVGSTIDLAITPHSGGQKIRGDRRQIEQVLMNLVVNARDAMPGGGRIEVRSESVEVSRPLRRNRVVVPAGSYLRISVVDEGAGIPSSKFDKIFEPFYTTKRDGEGTGLGLSTAYGIIKQSNGYIFVDSALGEGSEFSIYLPAVDVQQAAQGGPLGVQLAVELVQQEGKTRILLVEDEAPVRAFAARALEISGMEVEVAASGEEALAILSDHERPQFDLFLTDVVMPGLDGPDWVRKASQFYPSTPVVFMSGYTQEAFADKRALVEQSSFIAKPFTLAALSAAVTEQLRSSTLVH